MATKRNEGESFEDYKRRQKLESTAHRVRKQSGWKIHEGGSGTYTKARARAEVDLNAAGVMLFWILRCIMPPHPEDVILDALFACIMPPVTV